MTFRNIVGVYKKNQQEMSKTSKTLDAWVCGDDLKKGDKSFLIPLNF